MINSRKRIFGTLALAVASALTCGAATAAPKAAAAGAEKAAQSWSVWGGTVGVRWNRELAGDLGLVLGTANGRHASLSQREHETFDLRQAGGLEFNVLSGNLRDFVGGSLQARGGYVIDTPSGRIDLTDFRLTPRAGSDTILDLVSADGKAWFYIDRLMYELIENKQRLAIRTMDVRITPELAQRIGNPDVAGWAIADMEMTSEVLRQGPSAVPTPQADFKWHGTAVPGVPGAVYQADLFMSNFTVQYSRCNGCTGAGGPGQTVFTPSSTLRNNNNSGTAVATVAGDPLGTSTALYAADIPWYTKFSGNFAPYSNDQHPYLIWNLYRLNPDGSIDQIGRSGVKHAFLTINSSCTENPGDSHVLGRGCSDTYATGNNDSSSDLGPRSEVIPATNVWGRCGSIYDTNCDGLANATPNGSYDQRMVVTESQFSGTAQTGATYLFESWYLARQDINIYNSMASKRLTFTRSGNVWSVGGNDQYLLGPVIDRWVSPTAPPANAKSVEISTSEGHAKVAVKATDLGGGLWRYDYAVMNLNFSRVRADGFEPNVRVINNLGFDSFSVPVGAGTITNVSFSDGDMDASNDWISTIANGKITWSLSNRKNGLNWGTMFRFSFTVNQPPLPGTVTLHVAGGGSPQQLDAAGILAPLPPVRPAARTVSAAR